LQALAASRGAIRLQQAQEFRSTGSGVVARKDAEQITSVEKLEELLVIARRCIRYPSAKD
jgi:hypothetical protein